MRQTQLNKYRLLLLILSTCLFAGGCFHTDHSLECTADEDCLSGDCNHGVCERLIDTADTADTREPVLDIDEGQLYWVTDAWRGISEVLEVLPDDSIVIAGQFGSEATFGKDEANETNLVSRGVRDAFVARYKADGTLIWAKPMGGMEPDDFSADIAFAPGTNSLFVTGTYEDWAIFGEGEGQETVLSAQGAQDVFVAEFSADNGALRWAKNIGGALDNDSSVLSLIDAESLELSAMVVGTIDGSMTFGHGEAAETTINTPDGNGIFAAMYQRDGTLSWARSIAQAVHKHDAWVTDMDTFAGGSALIVGQFRNTVIFGAGENNETTLTNSGTDDVFVAKTDVDGNLQWARSVGRGPDAIQVAAVHGLPDGKFYITGSYRNLATFGAGEANEQILYPIGNQQIFVAKYDSEGALEWARSAAGAGGQSSTSGNSITSLPDGSALVAGNFEEAATFGKNEPNETTLETEGNHDVFIAKYNSDGTLAWVRQDGGSADANGIDVDSGGTAFAMTGSFGGTLTWGAGEPNETMIENTGGASIFVAKYAL